MKEIPILFSTPMVQAIIEGRKSQTRRLINPQPSTFLTALVWGKYVSHCPESCNEDQHVKTFFNDKCRYGKLGDILWVRETWGVGSRPDPFEGSIDGIEFKADSKFINDIEPLPLHRYENFDYGNYDKSGWRPSIHMPKAIARIWLQVTDIRVERLQDIEPSEAIDEGITEPEDCKGYIDNGIRISGVDAGIFFFKDLWESINGAESWQANPWVWAISFKVLSTTGKPDLCSPKS